jgi:hypothetical protein
MVIVYGSRWAELASRNMLLFDCAASASNAVANHKPVANG